MPSRTLARGALVLVTLAITAAAQTPDLYDTATVRTIALTFKQNDWWQQLTSNRSSKTDIAADLSVDGQTYPNVGVRFKSHASYNGAGSSLKKPFNISLDAFVGGQRLYGVKTLNLQNAFLDPTYVREVITLQMMRRYLPAPRANFVKLHINNLYWGLYVSVEQVNRDLIRRWFPRDDGNNYKADPQGSSTPSANSALVWLGQNPETYKKHYELKTGTAQSPWTDLVSLIDKLNNTQTSQLQAVLPSLIDVDRALWFMALQNVFCNLDSYIGAGHNYYLYHGAADGRFHLIPWDLNRSFGGYALGLSLTALKTLSPYFAEANSVTHPLVNRLLKVTGWQAQDVAHIRTLLAESFNRAAIDPLIKLYQDLIRSAVQADPNKLYAMSLFDLSVVQDIWVTVPGQSATQLIPGLKPFIDGRAGSLNTHPDLVRPVPVITNVTRSARPWGRDPVWITAKITATSGVSSAVLAYASTPGTFTTLAMFDDGNHNDGKAGDGVYGNAVPPHAFGTTVRYYLQATATAGGRTLDPPRAEMTTHAYTVGAPPARINEFVASNVTGIRDERGEREDWIEFHNTTGTAFNLAGCYLTDNLSLPTQWRFPTAGSVVAAGGTAIVWADNDPGQGPLHATFKLAKEGETIGLFDTDGKTLLDVFTFGAQSADVSTGRTASETAWVTYPSPTPYAANAPLNACGHLAYDALDPSGTGLGLTGTGTPSIGNQVTYSIDRAPASTPGFLALSLAPLHADLGSVGTLLLNPAGAALIPVVAAGNGAASVPLGIPNVAALRGVVFYLQAFVYNGVAATGGLSNGAMTQICP